MTNQVRTTGYRRPIEHGPKRNKGGGQRTLRRGRRHSGICRNKTRRHEASHTRQSPKQSEDCNLDFKSAVRDRQDILRLSHKNHKKRKHSPLTYFISTKNWGGGMGLLRFLDAVNVDKMVELLRGYRRTDEVAAAAKGVVERALR